MTEQEFFISYAVIGVITAAILFLTKEEDLRTDVRSSWDRRRTYTFRGGRGFAIFKAALVGTLWPWLLTNYLWCLIQATQKRIASKEDHD